MTEDREALLRRMWLGHANAEIAAELGFRGSHSVTHAARRLGLPPKEPKRTTERAQQVNRQRNAERKAQQEVGEHDPEMPEPPEREEQPVCWVCGGRSVGWDGHDSCRGKRGKAA